MNERLKLLSEQAEKYADENFKGEPTYSEAYDSKFAELIVRECIDIVKDVDKNPYLEDHHHARQINRNITKRFGIQ